MIAEDSEEMSEGQEADYESGNWGHAQCLACERVVDWGYWKALSIGFIMRDAPLLSQLSTITVSSCS
jgi:hypothetical protein